MLTTVFYALFAINFDHSSQREYFIFFKDMFNKWHLLFLAVLRSQKQLCVGKWNNSISDVFHMVYIKKTRSTIGGNILHAIAKDDRQPISIHDL